MKRFVVFIGILFVAFSIFSFYIESEIDAQHVILDFERQYGFSCSLCNADVFVNQIKIGSIRNQQSKRFRLPKNQDNRYAIKARVLGALELNIDSNVVEVEAEPGSVIHARLEVNSWTLWRARGEIVVGIVEDNSYSRWFLPRKLREDGSKLVSEFDEQMLELPWDAIGAIAGVVGTIATIVALFKSG